MSSEKSIAHTTGMNHFGEHLYRDGLVPWSDAVAPDLDKGITTGRLRHCSYCGSMHPADLATAIKAGAKGSWADRKYGWPHKAYFDGIPNPHAGLLESRSARNWAPENEEEAQKWTKVPTGFYDPGTGLPTYHWIEKGQPASRTTHGKFYTVHLKDASPEDRETIERHLGLRFTFTDDGMVSWEPVK